MQPSTDGGMVRERLCPPCEDNKHFLGDIFRKTVVTEPAPCAREHRSGVAFHQHPKGLFRAFGSVATKELSFWFHRARMFLYFSAHDSTKRDGIISTGFAK